MYGKAINYNFSSIMSMIWTDDMAEKVWLDVSVFMVILNSESEIR